MKFKKKVLPNGMRVITVPMKDNPTVTVMVLVETGSDYETKDINGLSHFLEHMCFKGTTKRPSAFVITSELDALGSQSNAFTDHEMTGYYAKADAKHFDKIFDIVADIYMNGTFPETEMEKEKGVVIEEINMYEDMPQRHVWELFEKIMYGDQPAGWSVIGTRENIRAMKRQHFLDYKKAHYVAESTILVVTGNIEEKTVLKEVKNYFGHISTDKKKRKKKTIDKQGEAKILLKHKATDQTHFVLGVRGFDVHSKNNPVVSVLSGILANGMSSRLFQLLREEMGVCYYVRAGADVATDHGYFYISSGVDTKRVHEVITAILNQCALLKKDLVSNDELKKVKQYLIGNMKLSLEASDDIAQFYGTQELLKGEIETADEKAKRIMAVTSEDIKKLANKLFVDKHLNLALIGPYETKDEDSFRKILKF